MVDLATIIAGVLVAAITGYFGWKTAQTERAKRGKAEREAVIARRKFSLAVKHKTYDAIRKDIQALMEGTCIERYVMLVAHNGIDQPILTTAIVQMRENGEPNVIYEDFAIDQHYRECLREIRDKKWIYMRVQDMPHNARIRAIYEDIEDVTATFWGLVSVNNVLEGVYEYTYITLSTRNEKGEIDEGCLERCRLILDRLRAQAAND